MNVLHNPKQQFSTSLVLVVGVPFWAVFGVQKIPPWTFRSRAAGVRIGGEDQTRTGGTGLRTEFRRNQNRLVSELNRTNLNRGLPVLRRLKDEISEHVDMHSGL